MKTNAAATLEPRELIRRMKDYHPPLGDRSGVRLDFNENTVACSPKVLEALGKVSRAALTMYPARERVERAVATHLGLTPNQVLLTNGVDEAIHVLCQTYLGAGDQMLLPVPTYSMYAVYASGTEAALVEVQSDESFHFPLTALLKKITHATKFIAIANPNSPTGQSVSREDIVRVIEAAPQAAVLVDEAYYHFHGNTVIDLVGRVPNLIVARTFSKVYGLAGLRLGLLAADAGQMQWLRRVISPYSVNSLALACLPAAMKDQAYIDQYVVEVLAARGEFAEALKKMSVPYWPSRANFVLIRIGAKHKEFAHAMHTRGILVRDRSADPGCDGCIRVTIGTREQMAKAAAAMKEALNEIGWMGDSK